MPDSLIQALVEDFSTLPGVGERSAQRMVYHLLHHDAATAERLVQHLNTALITLHNCSRCHNLAETDPCATCRHPKRDTTLLCVVEMPYDQLRIEQTHAYNGLYFVLLGRMSPLKGYGTQHIAMEKLFARIQDSPVTEVIIATSFTQEGEATAYTIAQQLNDLPIRVTRLARGVPAGAELEFVDAPTLAHALWDRK